MSSSSSLVPFVPGSREDPLVNAVNPPKVKKPNKPKPAPTAESPAVESARQDELAAARRRRGPRSTILTSPLGDTTPPNLQRNALLGS